MEDFHFGENLRKIREAKGVKQWVLAADMNISQTKLSRIEAEPHVPRDEIVEAAAKALNISTSELLPPEWSLKTVKRDAYVLNRPGHAWYVILLIIACGALVDEIFKGSLQFMEKIFSSAVAVVLFGLSYYFSFIKIKITKY